MAQPTDENHTGVEGFDHERLASAQEYHDAREALDTLVKRINNDDLGIGQGEWLRIAEQMAASLSYSDSSGHPDNGCHESHVGRWPYEVKLSDEHEDSLSGQYQCPACGAQWRIGHYAINIGDWT